MAPKRGQCSAVNTDELAERLCPHMPHPSAVQYAEDVHDGKLNSEKLLENKGFIRVVRNSVSNMLISPKNADKVCSNVAQLNQFKFKDIRQHKDWVTTMSKRIRTMLYHVRGGLNAKRKPKWVKKLFPEEFGEVADEDSLPIAAADSEPAAADSEPPEVDDEVPDETAAADSDLADGPAAKEDAKYIYGFSWEKMRAWRSKPEVAHGKKALKMWSGEPEEPPNAVETASMIATWKDGSSWSIPDYLVEEARKKKAVKENACRGGDKIVMYEVHKTSGETYKLHWKADRGKLL